MAAPRSRRYLGEVVSRRYMVDRLIGEGSFAWVYHARERSGDAVAVKILHSTQPTAAVRFAREIKVLKSLPPNPYVAQYIDHGETRDGRPLLVLELVDGITLKQGLERRPRLAPDKAVAFLAELCQAFAGLHQLGVAHRDVKPENILLARLGGIKLIDFGLIRDAQGILKLLEDADEGEAFDSRVFSQDLDRGVLAGTPEYMAPEQFSDSAVEDESDTKTDTHSDVFSLGVILYELLTGDKPFPMKEVANHEYAKELLRYLRWRIGLRDEDVPAVAGLDNALQSIVRKALRRDPKRRQPDSRVLMEDLVRYLDTGEGVKEADESRTMIVSVDSVLSSMPPPKSGGSVQTSIASPSRQRSSEGAPPAPAQADATDELEVSTASLSTVSPEDASRGPTGRGHTSPFFDEHSEGRPSKADPLGPTVNIGAERLGTEDLGRALTPPTSPRGDGSPFEDSGVRQDIVPTELVEGDDVWPEENLADPPRKGEPAVPAASTDSASLGEEDLFNLPEDDDDLAGFDGFVEDISEDETREVNLAELLPGEIAGGDKKR